MNYNTIIFEVKEGIGILKLNRPERMNAVNEEMYREIQDFLNKSKDDSSIRALIITGTSFQKGDVVKQAFCAGADLKKHSSGERSKSEKRDYIYLAHETTRMIYQFPKPVIAAINGPARGAGSEMALCCDFIFISENASLAFPETSLGTFVGGGVTYHLPRIIGLVKAKELIYTGKVIYGKDAVSLGLACQCGPVDELIDTTCEFASILAKRAPHSIGLAKKHLQESNNKSIEEVLNEEAEAILSCMETEDWHEGIKAFMEKRDPQFSGK